MFWSSLSFQDSKVGSELYEGQTIALLISLKNSYQP
jgi:hypothetical protein